MTETVKERHHLIKFYLNPQADRDASNQNSVPVNPAAPLRKSGR